MADYYQLLGVTPQASAAEIRQAYAKLAREQHPDRFTDPAAKQRRSVLPGHHHGLQHARQPEEPPGVRRRHRDKPVPRTPEEIATDAFERSKAAPEAGQLDEAVTLLHTAVHHAPERRLAYQLALGRALAKAAGHAGRPRGGPGAGEGDPARAAERRRPSPSWRRCWRAQGLKLRAQKAVEAALRIAPRDARIGRLAAELGVGQR